MHLTRGAAALSAAALITTGLSACGDDEPVEPTSSSTVSPLSGDSTTSSSPASGSTSSDSSSSSGAKSGLPDDIPAAALKETKEGAAAFGKYYYDKIADADHSGETADLVLLSVDSCPPCQQAIEDIDADAAQGKTRSKNPNTITNVTAIKRPDKGFKVSMNVKVKPHYVYKNGEPQAEVQAANYLLTEHVVWSGGRWQIADWVIS